MRARATIIYVSMCVSHVRERAASPSSSLFSRTSPPALLALCLSLFLSLILFLFFPDETAREGGGQSGGRLYTSPIRSRRSPSLPLASHGDYNAPFAPRRLSDSREIRAHGSSRLFRPLLRPTSLAELIETRARASSL